MKRSSFITSITTVGLGAILPNSELIANNSSETAIALSLSTEAAYYTEEEGKIPAILQTLENDFVKFDWYEDASATILIKQSQAVWRMGPVAYQENEEIEQGHVWVRKGRSSCEQYPGRFRGKLINGEAQFILLNRLNKIMGGFTCKVGLNEEAIVFTIKNIDEKIPNLCFPPPIENEKLVLPIGIGKLMSKPFSGANFLPMIATLNMRFFGGLNKKNGYVAIFENGFEDAGAMGVKMSVTPVWQKSLGKYAASRSIRYSFTSNGYVGIAKTFRAWFIQQGLFKSLREKIKETPQLASLVGGKLISVVAAWPARRKEMDEEHLQPQKANEQLTGKVNKVLSFSEMENLIADCKKAGLKNGVFCIRGWIRGGYDYSHPDVWPPEKDCGTAEELKKVCASPAPFTVVLHDNYQDIYEHNPSFPKGVIFNKKGSNMLGGYWASGQAYIVSSKQSIKNSKANWEKIKFLNPPGFYVDTITTVQLYESYTPGNTQSRSQDLQQKIQLMQLYKNRKQILGSEDGADIGIKYQDWGENRHERTEGETIPLWTLVFHDAIFDTCYLEIPIDESANNEAALSHLLWGHNIMFWADNAAKMKAQPAAIAHTQFVDDWHRQIALEEMTDHQFLTEDASVEKTSFANGKSITVNFSKEIKVVDGTTYQPASYTIFKKI